MATGSNSKKGNLNLGLPQQSDVLWSLDARSHFEQWLQTLQFSSKTFQLAVTDINMKVSSFASL